MITRSPSIQKNYDAFWSRDPAFVQLASDATDEQREEHARKWRVARETGGYGDLLVEGAQPTKFELRPIPSRVTRKMIDHAMAERIGGLEQAALAFRAAVVDVVNFGDVKIKMVDSEYGQIASEDVTDLLDVVAPGLVNELGGLALERALGLAGK